MKSKRVFSMLFISTLTIMLFVGCNNLNQKAQKEEVIISADYYNYDTDDDLINNSDVIVEGKILNYKSEYLSVGEYSESSNEEENPGGEIDMTQLPYTIFQVEVYKNYKGNIDKKTIIEVKQLGGDFDNITFSENNTTPLKKNQKYVFFLKQYEDSPFSLLNPVQGTYLSENGKLIQNNKNSVKMDLNKLEKINKK